MYILAFDYGSKHIGIAVGQTLTGTASPAATIPVKNQKIDWSRITAIIQEWRPIALVVGVPTHADGSENPTTKAALRFSRQLQGRYQMPVHTIDERLSSVAATDRIVFKGRSSADIHAVAAQVIFETWLASQPIKLEGRRDSVA